MAVHLHIGVEDVLKEAKKYISNPDSLQIIQHAANYASEHHAGQFRKSGEPYFVHCINVAYILATLQVGPNTIAAGFLHDTIEDTGISKQELAEEFGEEIAEMVEAVTKIGSLKFKGKDDPEYQASNHRKIFIAMAKDIRVILVKLADRLHNMRTLEYQPEASQKRIAAETLDVYAPIAHRLGISSIKNELEDLCFYYLNREEYYHIAKLVESKKAERDEAVNHMIQEITEMLQKNHIQFRIFGRSKHLYSIYNKMTKKHKRFDEILDLLAIRIITLSELNCYEILGYIHAKYRPIPGRLKDYIAVPKTNMYQSYILQLSEITVKYLKSRYVLKKWIRLQNVVLQHIGDIKKAPNMMQRRNRKKLKTNYPGLKTLQSIQKKLPRIVMRLNIWPHYSVMYLKLMYMS